VTDEDRSQKNDNENNNSICDNININNNNVVDNDDTADDKNDVAVDAKMMQTDSTVEETFSGKTDDERLMQISDDAPLNPANGSDQKCDEDLKEKNESEKSGKEEKVEEEEVCVGISEAIDDKVVQKLEDTRIVDEVGDEAPEEDGPPTVPAIVEPAATKEELQVSML